MKLAIRLSSIFVMMTFLSGCVAVAAAGVGAAGGYYAGKHYKIVKKDSD